MVVTVAMIATEPSQVLVGISRVAGRFDHLGVLLTLKPSMRGRSRGCRGDASSNDRMIVLSLMKVQMEVVKLCVAEFVCVCYGEEEKTC